MFSNDEQTIIDQALAILASKTNTHDVISQPALAINLCKLELAGLAREAFGVLLLNNQNRVIRFEILFWGTINAASVYPREVVKTVLEHNAAAVILTHNHPSGEAEPSGADRAITDVLVQALNLIDVRVLDHIVVANDRHVSFAERGLL